MIDQKPAQEPPFSAHSRDMAPNRGAVDHVLPVVGQAEIDERLQQGIPDALLGSASKPHIDGVPLAVALMHVHDNILSESALGRCRTLGFEAGRSLPTLDEAFCAAAGWDKADTRTAARAVILTCASFIQVTPDFDAVASGPALHRILPPFLQLL